jgi:signal recognition particle subunit SRP54
VRHVTGRPIAFVGVGEKLDALEPFHPERLASRLVGMGDVLSLVEKAQAAVDQKQAEELARKIRQETFTLEDFRDQLRHVRGMGPLDQILGMLPLGKALRGVPADLTEEQSELARFEAIIDSMTPEERRDAQIINGSRRARIARGSGTTVPDVNRLLKQYAELRRMMRGLRGLEGKLKKRGRMPGWPSVSG